MQWLLKLSSEFLRFAGKSVDYNRIKNIVEEASKYNMQPFKSWFPAESNRVYLTFNKSSDEKFDSNDLMVIDFLQNLRFSVDYKSGIAVKNRKKIRIGKLLSDLLAVSVNPSEIDILNQLKNIFDNSKTRSLSKRKKPLLVVISQDPHDIAQMSTGRGWKSCNELDTTGKYDNGIYLCEIKSGGLIAYLIVDDDVEIKRPISRILIRRFVSEDGKNIAVPEKKIYGTQVNGFLEIVEEWISDHQKIIPDIYHLSGIPHSDTLPKSHFAFDKNISIENLTKAITHYNGNYNQGKLISDLVYKNINSISDNTFFNFIEKILSYEGFDFLNFNDDRTVKFCIEHDWVMDILLILAKKYQNRFLEKVRGTKVEQILTRSTNDKYS